MVRRMAYRATSTVRAVSIEMKSAVALRHIAVEGLGVFEDVLTEHGYDVEYVDVWKDEIAASLATGPDLLIVLGGPMGVYEADQYPFLNAEIRVLQGRLMAGKPLLGICLGSQLIAHAAGARVYPGGQKEIGYAPLTLTPAGQASCLNGLAEAGYYVLHWHGDTFDLPTGAELLCSTPVTVNQGFKLGPNVLALQFHMEALPSDMEAWAAISGDYLASAGVRLDDVRKDAGQYGKLAADAGARVFGQWLQSLV